MEDKDETWATYSKLVLKELERLGDNYDRMQDSYDKIRDYFDEKFSEINRKLSEVKNMENVFLDNKEWIKEVNDVWSPAQMKEAKDELYAQKMKWAVTVGALIFFEVASAIAMAIWNHYK